MAKSFPRSLRFDDHIGWWQGTVTSPQLTAVKISLPGRRRKSGKIDLFVEADEEGPSEAQAAAYQYCLEHPRKVLDSCLAGVARVGKKFRRVLKDFFEPDRLDQLLPKDATPRDMRSRVRLNAVQITGREKGGTAYIEYHFDCA